MSPLNLIWIWDGVTLLCVHPYSLWEGKDWMTAVYFSPCTHQKSTKALLKWRPGNNPGVRPGGGHHPRALCSCQEPFTPSRFSPNGTSESIKTIITAIPESKEIILGCQGKHGKGVWSYLVRNLLDMHLARQAITASISGGFFLFFFFVVWILCWLLHWTCSQTDHCLRMRVAHFDRSWWAPGGKQKSMSVLDEVQTLSTTVFLLPP